MITMIHHTQAVTPAITTMSAIAAAEILHAFNSTAPITGAEIITLAHDLDVQQVLMGVDAALNLMTPGQLELAIAHSTIEAPPTGLDAPALIPTEAQADIAAHLIGIPGAIYSVFGF